MSFLLTNFPYKWETPGAVQEIQLPPGQYKIELWGAQGGRGIDDGEQQGYGGKGAYTVGELKVEGSTQTFFCRVGGKGETGKRRSNKGGWNGGGDSGEDTADVEWPGDYEGSGGGGGATDIRYGDSVDTRIMVAAGGSGSACDCNGAPGGTLSGYFAEYSGSQGYFYSVSPNVNQINGNAAGRGGDGQNSRYIPGSGGGGGWRGGKGDGYALTNKHTAVAHSGSSYISGYPGCTPNPKYTFTDVDMKDGLSTIAKEGNGKILVTLLYQCSDHCVDCNSADKCNKCESGYLMYRQSETSVSCHKNCPKGTYLNGNECSKCLNSCSECSSQMFCTNCNEGHFFYQNLCYPQCPLGTIQDGKNCLKCKTGCSKCETTVDNCLICQEGFYLKDNRCYSDCSVLNDKTTSYGKNSADQTCSRCSIEFCNSCSQDYTKCTSCFDSHFLNENNQCQIKPTSTFTRSDFFTPSSSFTKSSSFSESSSFTKSTAFSKSSSFTKSSVFSKSNEFTKTKTFSSSTTFTRSNRFTKSNYFTSSSGFSSSSHFTAANPNDQNDNFNSTRGNKSSFPSYMIYIIVAFAAVIICLVFFIIFWKRSRKQNQDQEDEMSSTLENSVTPYHVSETNNDFDVDSLGHEIMDPFNMDMEEVGKIPGNMI